MQSKFKSGAASAPLIYLDAEGGSANTARCDPDLNLLDERETASILGCAVSTLQKHRVSGGGIPFVKLGRLVRYRRADVLAYLQGHVRRSTSDEV